MGNLPESWIEVALDQILTSLESGSRPKGGVRGIADGIPSLGGEHLNYNGGFKFENVKYVPAEFARKMKRGHIKRNDILVVKDGATTGKTSHVNESFPYAEAVINEHVFICRPSEKLESRFIFRFLMSQEGQKRILENFQGSAQGGINLSFAPNTVIPLAPLNEQKRIVAKLEKLLAEVDTAQARLAKIPQILKRFRQSVLMQAVTGELTKDWRGQNNIINNWNDAKLSDVIIEKPRNGFSPQGVNYETKIKNLTLTATTSGKFKPDCYKYVDIEVPEGSYLWLKTGDILIQRSNSIDYVGTSAIYDGKDNEYIYPDLMMKVKTNEKMLPEFLLYSLSNEATRSYFRQNATGTAGNMPKINQGTVMNVPILLPSIDEQKEIVKRVKALFEKADKIEERYKKAKSFTDKLTQSILNKAFKGELVPQDPSDEPASVLLESIKTSE